MPKKKPKKFYGGRAMLNEVGHHATGAIVAEIQDTSEHGVERGARGNKIGASYWEPVYPVVAISDCSRSVSLDFSVDPENAENDLAKIDTMIELLKDFRDGFEAEMKLNAARHKHAEKIRKRKKKKKND